MNFSYTQEQIDYRDQLRKFAQKNWSVSQIALRADNTARISDSVWKQMEDDLSLLSLSVPEEFGGAGFDRVDLGIAFSEFGRVLVGGEFFATCALAIPCLLETGDPAAIERLMPQLISGEKRATVAFPARKSSVRPAAKVDATRIDKDVFRLTGCAEHVLCAESADIIFVAAECSEGLGFFELSSSSQGLSRYPLNCVDSTRQHSNLEFQDVEARLLGEPSSTEQVLEKLLNIAKTLLACEQIGGAEQCMDIAVEYAKERKQFGVAIGSFQVIKHKCADMLIALEPARSAAQYSSWAVANQADQLQAVANIAKMESSKAYSDIAAHAVQIHGGVGITWDHPVSWFFRRAVWSGAFLGSQDECAQSLGEAVGL